jgi:hypothetical protein
MIAKLQLNNWCLGFQRTVSTEQDIRPTPMEYIWFRNPLNILASHNVPMKRMQYGSSRIKAPLCQVLFVPGPLCQVLLCQVYGSFFLLSIATTVQKKNIFEKKKNKK